MIDLKAVMEMMAMAMVQAIEHSSGSGETVVVSFVVEGGTGRIAPILKPAGHVFVGQIRPQGMVGEFKP